MTEIQRFDGSSWVDIRINGQSITPWQIENGLSDSIIAPQAEVNTDVRETVNAGEELRIREDGTTIFQGRLTSSGKRQSNGARKLKAEHRAYELFEERVSFTSTNPTASDVLTDALAASNIGGSFTLNFLASDPALADDYEADNRPVKRVFRDITDRTGTAWWVAGASDEITVDDYGGRGLWESVNTATDTARVQSFDPDNVETVVNDVTVNGTGQERVTGTATDATSINDFGRRPKTVNVQYITSQSEADDYASALLAPDPLPEAEVLIGSNVGTNPETNLSNSEIAIDDTNGTGLNSTLVVEKQTVTQSKVTFDLGRGRATSLAELNRQSKSQEDTTEPGSVYDSDRIADGAISDTKLVDLSVTEEKLADLAVSLNKLQDNAVIEGKLADLSVSETKVQDDAISTPKLQAEAVVAGKIDANTITANEIAAGTITAFEIEAGTITTNQIDTRTIRAINIATDELTANEINALDLDTQELTIGNDTDHRIEFTSESGETAIVSDGDGFAYLGLDNQRFNFGYFKSLRTESFVFDGATNTNISITELVSGDPSIEPQDDGEGLIGTEFRTWGEGHFVDLFFEDGEIGDPSDDTINVINFTSETGLSPSTDGTCQLGDSSNGYSSVWAEQFVDSTTGTAINDGGDPLVGLAADPTPPDHCRPCDDDGNPAGVSINELAKTAYEICSAQQRRIEDLEARIESLENA